ncbi:ABC transporter substrate-binding protein [Aquimarina sp. W85]|uniref:ABC transporter substrate-binding protein n=1 Tax=Aquimarina rhodophyticola TaxID=3342246 RepID=UPI00366E0AA4
MKTFIDQLSRRGKMHHSVPTIVSLVPSQTELLIDLGLKAQVVGITKFCVHPKDLRKKKVVVGGTKKINYEKIQKLKPDIILCNKEENTKEIVETLEKDYAVHVSDIITLKSALQLITDYGVLFDKEEKAAEIVKRIRAEHTDFKMYVQSFVPKTVLYFIWKNPWMIAGTSTFIQSLLKENNLKNKYEGSERYPCLNIETDTNYKNVELILLSSEPYPFTIKHIDELKIQFPSARVLLVDGEYFSWYGSRLQYAFSYFKSLQKTIRHG